MCVQEFEKAASVNEYTEYMVWVGLLSLFVTLLTLRFVVLYWALGWVVIRCNLDVGRMNNTKHLIGLTHPGVRATFPHDLHICALCFDGYLQLARVVGLNGDDIRQQL